MIIKADWMHVSINTIPAASQREAREVFPRCIIANLVPERGQAGR